MTRLSAAGTHGMLHDFDTAGVLSVADVRVAERLGALTSEIDERVLLAAALVVRSTRQGSVVLDLRGVADTVTPDEDAEVPDDVELTWPAAEDWIAACASSPLTAEAEGGSPLRMAGSRLWLQRYWRQEADVAEQLLTRSASRPVDLDLDRLREDLDALFLRDDEADQRHATAVALLSRVSVIAGGPGTGKTTTIARLLAVLLRQHPALRVALAAPTGKAAARLEEAIQDAAGAGADGNPLSDADRVALRRLPATTLHRLLKWRPGSGGRFAHDRTNRLPYDLVVVDECSMVSLTLMARLLDALPSAARLVLVGDPDQLASVEAGAVLGDLVDPADVGPVTNELATALHAVGCAPGQIRPAHPGAGLRESVAVLRTVHRFDAGGPIARLADHVRAGRADEALALLRSGVPRLVLHETADDEALSGAALAAVQQQAHQEQAVIAAARAGDVAAALDALDQHRLLCAHRSGPRGVRHWSDAVERWLVTADPTVTPRLDGHYAGQPLLVTANDYENELFNGDTGVVVERGGELVAAFRRGGLPTLVPLVRLSAVRPLHAMTVHRAQGSQFREVTVLLPFAGSPLATRQSFYTAVTRASGTVAVVGSAEAVLACVTRPTARATGLRDRLAGRLG